MSMHQSSTDIVGYTHSNGYCLCETHAYSPALGVPFSDRGNESGEVQPIFADSEWDTIPTCDVCGEPLEVVLTNDGIAYFEERGFTGDSSDIYNALLNIYIAQQEENQQ